MPNAWSLSRRRFFAKLAATSVFLATPRLFAEELLKTPPQTEGPFYPDKLPLDTDNDLIIINERLTPAVGQIAHLTGRVLDSRGQPLRNALVEIWQCDNNGVYMHTRDRGQDKRDSNFQSFGRFLTGSTGDYYFRTIKPVPYPGRTPHIHVKVKHNGKEALTTQCYVKGHPQNDRDGVLRGIRDKKALDSIMVDFAPLKESRINEVAGTFNIVLGTTPEA